ncbi:hypothetical protein [Streptomyces sp. AC495_CC817]|uniref:hypothetical protein n=1 Tax=Streptomyces sp. AC495_CC817 TaxID=2823900 RepID=UPI001C2811C1|nr:hypothetical protein [Streptomyces sp. AC495_CC817]
MEREQMAGHEDPSVPGRVTAPPTADAAQALLASLDVVARSREARVDRRLLARLHFVNGIAFAAYFGAVLSIFPAGPPAGPTTIGLIIPFLIWTQLLEEFRHSRGFQSRMTRAQTFAYAGAIAVFLAVVIACMAITGSGGQPPALLLAAPPLALLAAFWAMGFRELRRAGAPVPAPASSPWTPAARVTTMGIGVLLGALVFAAGSAQETPLVQWSVVYCGFAVLIAWMIAVRASSRMPAVGAVWRPVQWAAFAVACAVYCVVVIAEAYTTAISPGIAAALGGAVVLLFVVVGALRDE